MSLYAGIDVGGTNLRIGVVENMRLIHAKRLYADFAQVCRNNAPAIAWPQIVAEIGQVLEQVLLVFPDIVSVGIGFPGFIDPVSGIILQSPNLPGLRNVDLAANLSGSIGRLIVVENDAVAAAYGEYCLTLNTISPNLIYIGLGTGVGGGFIYAGRPYVGQHGTAMEIGHIIVESSDSARPCGCGNRGCLEQYSSASGVALSYKLMTGLDLDAIELAESARTGDEHALAAYSLAGVQLGRVVAHLSKVLDIGQVVIGGGLSNAWDLMEEGFKRQLQSDLIPALRDNLYARISTSGDEAGMIGAAMLSSL
jgi:glucokinase